MRLIIALFALCWAAPSWAATYVYTGGVLTGTYSGAALPPTNGGYLGVGGLVGPLEGERLTITIKTADLLTEGDYRQSGLIAQIDVGPLSVFTTDVFLSIAASGDIETWDIVFDRGIVDFVRITSYFYEGYGSRESVSYYQEYCAAPPCDNSGTDSDEYGVFSAAAGTWTVPASAEAPPVPLPASGFLLLTPLALLALRRRQPA